MTNRILIVAAGALMILASILFEPPAGLTQAGFVTLATLAAMALLWFTEALPVSATALLPFLVLPLANAGSMKQVANAYMSDIIFLVLGASLLALAVERWGLHRRLALNVVRRSGARPRALVFAFIIATMALSMWISNTATALIMTPIAVAVLHAALPPLEAQSPSERNFGRALVLAVAFGATLGGMGTLVGSPTNGIAVGIIKDELGVEINFLQWLAFGVPILVIAAPLLHAILTRLVFRLDDRPLDKAAIEAAIGEPGPLTEPERRLLPILALAVGGWLAGPLLKQAVPALDDASVAIFAALLLFLVPADDKQPALLDWADTTRAPWDVLLLFGGGLALADAMTRNGVAAWVGEGLSGLGAAPLLVVVLALIAMLMLVTEFASNVATAAGFTPVLVGLVSATGLDPLPLAMTVAIAASWGFMMPASTAANAIALSTRAIEVREMIKAGAALNVTAFVVIPIAILIGMTLVG